MQWKKRNDICERRMWESPGMIYYNKLNPHKGPVSSYGYSHIIDEETKVWSI